MMYLISKAGMMAQDYPERVADEIRLIAKTHRVKSFEALTVTSSRVFFVGEGDYIHGVMGNGTGPIFGFQTVSQHNVGGSGMSHAIGEEFNMPNGSYLIRVFYYTKYWMTVYRIQEVIE